MSLKSNSIYPKVKNFNYLLQGEKEEIKVWNKQFELGKDIQNFHQQNKNYNNGDLILISPTYNKLVSKNQKQRQKQISLHQGEYVLKNLKRDSIQSIIPEIFQQKSKVVNDFQNERLQKTNEDVNMLKGGRKGRLEDCFQKKNFQKELHNYKEELNKLREEKKLSYLFQNNKVNQKENQQNSGKKNFRNLVQQNQLKLKNINKVVLSLPQTTLSQKNTLKGYSIQKLDQSESKRKSEQKQFRNKSLDFQDNDFLKDKTQISAREKQINKTKQRKMVYSSIETDYQKSLEYQSDILDNQEQTENEVEEGFQSENQFQNLGFIQKQYNQASFNETNTSYFKPQQRYKNKENLHIQNLSQNNYRHQSLHEINNTENNQNFNNQSQLQFINEQQSNILKIDISNNIQSKKIKLASVYDFLFPSLDAQPQKIELKKNLMFLRKRNINEYKKLHSPLPNNYFQIDLNQFSQYKSKN